MKTKIEYKPDLSAYFPYRVYYYSNIYKTWKESKSLANLDAAKEAALELSKEHEDCPPIYFENGKEL